MICAFFLFASLLFVVIAIDAVACSSSLPPLMMQTFIHTLRIEGADSLLRVDLPLGHNWQFHFYSNLIDSTNFIRSSVSPPPSYPQSVFHRR